MNYGKEGESEGEFASSGFSVDPPKVNSSSDSVKDFDSEGSDGNFHEIQRFIAENCPAVAGMSMPITYEECEKIVEKFGKNMKTVFSVLEQMENYKYLKKKYYSTFLTLKNWLENQASWSSGNSNRHSPQSKELKQFEKKALESKSVVY